MSHRGRRWTAGRGRCRGWSARGRRCGWRRSRRRLGLTPTRTLQNRWPIRPSGRCSRGRSSSRIGLTRNRTLQNRRPVRIIPHFFRLLRRRCGCFFLGFRGCDLRRRLPFSLSAPGGFSSLCARHRKESLRDAGFYSLINRVGIKRKRHRRGFVSAGVIEFTIDHDHDRQQRDFATRRDLNQSQRARAGGFLGPARTLGQKKVCQNQSHTHADDGAPSGTI